MPATKFADLPLADEGVAWDAGAAHARVVEWAGGADDIDWAKYAKAFFWRDPENDETQGGYKLPFADVVGGQLRAVWRGVAGAYGAMQGSRQPINIPAEDEAGVLSHIRKYYDKFEKPWPGKSAESPRHGVTGFGHVHIMQFKATAADGPDGVRAIEGYASTPAEDSYRERVLPSAFLRDLPQFMANPLVTWMHNVYELPIGHVEAAEVRADGLWVRIIMSKTIAKAQEVWGAITEGLVRSLSIGFDGDYSPEWGHIDGGAPAGRSAPVNETWVWERVKLREIAVVTLPANADATFSLAKSLGLPAQRPEVGRTNIDHEEVRALDDLARLSGSCESLRNITRHWMRAGGAPSSRVLEAATSPIVACAEVLKVGQVLAAANRQAIESARDALNEVLDRDAAARSAREGGDAKPDAAEDKRAASPPRIRIIL